jgi:hypothetical protein
MNKQQFKNLIKETVKEIVLESKEDYYAIGRRGLRADEATFETFVTDSQLENEISEAQAKKARKLKAKGKLARTPINVAFYAKYIGSSSDLASYKKKSKEVDNLYGKIADLNDKADKIKKELIGKDVKV